MAQALKPAYSIPPAIQSTGAMSYANPFSSGFFQGSNPFSSWSSTQYNNTQQVFPWMWFILGIVVCIIVVWILYQVISRADTRPVSESFLSMPVKGASGVPCGQMSSESEELYSMFSSAKLNNMNDTDLDLRNLKDLLGKLCCLKRDLMSPLQSVSSSRELQFATHMDIQPVADLTASCFAKTIPERDLSIQFDKWKDFGIKTIHRLSVAASFTETQVQNAESLFKAAWQDAYNVAQESCIGSIPKGVFTTGPHDPAPMSPESIADLRPYDGRY